MKLLPYLSLVSGLLIGITGCGPAAPTPGEKPNAPAPPGSVAPLTAAQHKNIRAGIVLGAGGADDHAFNAAAVAGLNRAQQELGLDKANVKYVESRSPVDFKPNLTGFASQNYDIVLAVGYQLQHAVQEVAPQFPNVKFALVDSPAPNSPNCVGLLFREQDGAFLAGFLAASVTKTKKIGYVGGERIPITERVEAGYRAGAKTADPNVVVSATYTGDWNDQSKGRSQAEQQFASGADILLQGAGKSGLGVIEAARERGAGYYAIGTDQDQDDLAPGRVLTTLIKHTDYAVFDTIRRVQAGTFVPGTSVYGLKEGGIGISDMRHTKQVVPAAAREKLEKLKKLISDGTVVPPTTAKDLESFQPPKL